MKPVDKGMVLWAGTLRTFSVEVRLAAAASAGYRVVTLSPREYRQFDDSPAKAKAFVQRAADLGIVIDVIDAITEWYPHKPPSARNLDMVCEVERGLDICEAFGAKTFTALCPWPGELDVDGMAECFARLCDQAAARGLRAALEFTPYPPMPDLATAWEVIRRADRPNGGMIFDTWHFFRGKPDLELLAQIPGERIYGVQMSDGLEGFVESLIKDTYMHRRLPGEGSFALAKVVEILRQTGGLNAVGPEVLSLELQALDPAVAGRRAWEATAKLLQQVERPA